MSNQQNPRLINVMPKSHPNDDTQRPFAIIARPTNNKTVEEMTEEVRDKISELKKQAAIEPKRVSECLEDILKYVNDNKEDDGFINGKLATTNPYVPKKRCPML